MIAFCDSSSQAPTSIKEQISILPDLFFHIFLCSYADPILFAFSPCSL
jgi:hypothetical protein